MSDQQRKKPRPDRSRNGEASRDKPADRPAKRPADRDRSADRPTDRPGRPGAPRSGGKPGGKTGGSHGGRPSQDKGGEGHSRPDRAGAGKPGGSRSGRPSQDKSGEGHSRPDRAGAGKPGGKPGGSHGGRPNQDKGGEGHSRPDRAGSGKPGGKPGDSRSGRPGNDRGGEGHSRPDRSRPDKTYEDKGRPEKAWPEKSGAKKYEPQKYEQDRGRSGKTGSDKNWPGEGRDKGRSQDRDQNRDRSWGQDRDRNRDQSHGQDRDRSRSQDRDQNRDRSWGQDAGRGRGRDSESRPSRPHSGRPRSDRGGAPAEGRSGARNAFDRADGQNRNRAGHNRDDFNRDGRDRDGSNRDGREFATARAPRPAIAHSNAWKGATPLFPTLTEETRAILDQLPEVLARVWPLSAAHRRSLPDDIARLSRLLTTERAALDRPYWSTPAFVSAYLYYFLPWNLVRLTRLLAAMPLPDPQAVASQGGKALLLDTGSGPLTLPLALWLARPEWRQAPIQVLALDSSSQPLELGRSLLHEVAALTFHQPWQVQTVRAPLEQAARQAAPLLAGGQARPWLVSAANVLNELRFGKKSGRASALDSYDEDDDAPLMGVMDDPDMDGRADLGQSADPDERPDDCRQERLARFLDALAPLFRSHGRPADGAEGQPSGPSLLFVEPGTRLGGSTIMDLRHLAVEGGLTALAPCPHQAACPLLSGQGGRTWCHFTFGSEDAPRWLEDLSADAGLGKSGLSLAPLLLSPVAAPEVATGQEQGRKTSGSMKARVLTAPFAVPGLAGRGRYACAACGLLLLEDADGLPSGSLLEVQVPPDARRDAKSGARIVRRPGSGTASPAGPGSAPAGHAPRAAVPAHPDRTAPKPRRPRPEAPAPRRPFSAGNSGMPQRRGGKGGKKA